jgi:glycosyltransferase involved in cell wall biosynthesis
MHIAYIHQYFTTRFGSSGTRSYEFARRWVRAGHHVTVITSAAQLQKEELSRAKNIKRGLKKLCVEGIEVLAMEIPYHQSMDYSRRAWSFLRFLTKSTFILARLKNVDIAYATSTPLTVTVPVLVNKFCRAIPYIFEVRDLQPRGVIAHGYIKNYFAKKFLFWLEKLTYDQAVGIVALTTDMKDYIDRVTKKPAKTITVPNCSDNDIFKPLKDTEKQKVRAELGWENKFIVIHAGAMGKVNGLYRIVEVASRVQGHHEICFIFIGEGREKPRLEQLVKNLKLNNVIFMNPLPKSDLAKVLPAADVGLVSIDKMPHMQFNCANKFFDTLACGMPVLINYAGWQKEVLDKYHAGLGCNIFDDNEFIENLLALAKDPAMRHKMGQNARKLAESAYDRDVLATKVLDYISQCFAKSQIKYDDTG